MFVNKKTLARQRALMALYLNYQNPEVKIEDALKQVEVYALENADFQARFAKNHFKQLVEAVFELKGDIDSLLSQHLDRPIKNLEPIEVCLLRLSVAEWVVFPQTPHKVLVNEAINLSHQFGNSNAFRYINAVLEKCHQGLENHPKLADIRAQKLKSALLPLSPA